MCIRRCLERSSESNRILKETYVFVVGPLARSGHDVTRETINDRLRTVVYRGRSRRE